MAGSQKGDCSSVSVKEKDALEDLDIGKDFLTSWKSVSIAEDDGLDFDLTPVSKGDKKSFDFGKADMNFDFDGDFGKMSSFNMDMSDLDISPPLKNDGKSKEKSKESSCGKDTGSSFNIDMSDLDISLPLNKDGKSKEKLKESSSKKDAGKTDRFAFAFDFDESDNFSLSACLTKDDSISQRNKSIKKSSSDGSGYQDKEGSMCMNATGSKSTLEDGPKKPFLPESRITFDMDCLVGGSVDLEPKRKTGHPNLGMNDAVTKEQAFETDEVESDKTKSGPQKTIVSTNSPTIEIASHGPNDLEASTGDDVVKELSSEYLPKNEPCGGGSSEAQGKDDSVNNKASALNRKQDAKMISVSSSTRTYENRMSNNSQYLQEVTISEKVNNEKSKDGVEDHVIDNRGKTETASIDSFVENPCTTSAGIVCDSSSVTENQQPASENLELPLISEPADLSMKQIENRREPLVNCSKPFIQPEGPERPLLKVSAITMFSSLSSKKMDCPQPSLVEGRRDGNNIQNDKKPASLFLPHSKTILRGELAQTQSQENCNGVKIFGVMNSANGIQDGKKMNDSSETQIKDTVKTKPMMKLREMTLKNLDTLSTSISKREAKISENPRAKISENPTTLASVPTIKNTPVEELRLSSTEGGRKTPDLPGLKLTGLNLDSTKTLLQKDSRSVGNISQKSILLTKKPSDIAPSPDTQKQTPSIMSLKRTLEEDAANSIAVHPSKRPFLSASTSRNLVETSDKVLNKKVPSHNEMEDDRSRSKVGNYQLMAIGVPHEIKNKEVEISFSTQNDHNIRLADALSKELDDLCNIVRKKHDEAKELLAQAIVNSNQLLMLNNPRFEEKISYYISTV